MSRELMKRRGGKSFRQASKNRQKASNRRGRRRGGIVEGRFERWTPGKKAVWIYIPPQSYTYDIYDKDEKAVIRMEDYPYYERVDHFVPPKYTSPKYPKGMGFTCSAGPHRDKPCYGDKLRDLHFNRLDEEEERTGVRPQDWAPVGKSNRFAMSVVLMEHILQIPKTRTKNGKTEVVKTKKGTTIYDYVPVPVSNMDDEDMAKISTKYGHKAHWSFPPGHLDRLVEEISPRVMNHCGNCATEMVATGFICPSCESVAPLRQALMGEDLIAARQKNRKCSACQSRSDEWVAILDCPGCGDPTEGQLIGLFDLRLKAVPAGGDSKSTILELVGVRMHGAPDDVEMSEEELDKLCANPLDLPKIFAPTSIDDQKKIFKKDVIKGIDPSLEDPSESYSDEGEDDDMDLPDSLR